MTTALQVLAILVIVDIFALSIAALTDDGSRLQRLAIIVLMLPLFMFGQLMSWAEVRKEA